MNICRSASFGAILPLALSITVCVSTAQESTSSGPQVFDTRDAKIRVVPVATGLYHPWSLAFADPHTLLVSERNGKLRIIRDGVLQPDAAWTSPTPPGDAGEALHFVAIHPNFAQNQLVYVSYPKHDGDRVTLAVARGRLSGSKLTDVKEIFVADAWETGGNLAGRIYFTPDSMLYVTVGDRDRLCCTGTEDNSLRMKAQALNNDVGKTLRLRDDGTVPPDNPFVGRAGAKPQLLSISTRGCSMRGHKQWKQP